MSTDSPTPGPSEGIDARLGRSAGQVAGIRRMVDDHRPCPEILDQLAAVRGALRAAAEQVATAGVHDCLDTRMTTPEDSVDDRIADALAIIHRLGSW